MLFLSLFIFLYNFYFIKPTMNKLLIVSLALSTVAFAQGDKKLKESECQTLGNPVDLEATVCLSEIDDDSPTIGKETCACLDKYKKFFTDRPECVLDTGTSSSYGTYKVFCDMYKCKDCPVSPLTVQLRYFPLKMMQLLVLLKFLWMTLQMRADVNA